MKETDLAWLAGIWDGEGSIHMASQAKRYISPTLSMDNTDPNIIAETIRILKEIGINVHINEYKNKKGSTRPTYRIATAKLSNIKIFAEKVGPFLQSEKKAKMCLMYNFVNSRLNNGKGNKYSEEEVNIFNTLRSSETTREAA